MSAEAESDFVARVDITTVATLREKLVPEALIEPGPFLSGWGSEKRWLGSFSLSRSRLASFLPL